MNKESCSSLVFIKFANGERFGVCVRSWERKKKKCIYCTYMYCTRTYT